METSAGLKNSLVAVFLVLTTKMLCYDISNEVLCMKLKKTIWLSCCFLVALSACSKPVPQESVQEGNLTKTQEEFNAFMHEQLLEELQEDYYTLHSSLEDPQAYGIDVSKVEKTFGRIDAASMEEERTDIQFDKEKLQKFDVQDLTPQQKDTYNIYMYQLSVSEKLSNPKFDYIGSAFSPLTGLQVSFPQIFSDWKLYSQQDAQDLILMVEDVDDYVQSAIDYTYVQNEKGLLCMNFDEVIDYSQKVLDKGEDSSALTSMEDQIDELDLADAKEKELKKQLKEAFTDSYLHGYQLIVQAMQDLQANGVNHASGLSLLEGGKEYYEVLFQSQIGSDTSIQDIEDMMKEKGEAHMQEMAKYMGNSLSFLMMKTDYDSYEAMLKDIQGQFFKNFPEIDSLDYEIKDMEEDIATDNGMLAYYLIPTLDGDVTGQLRVNPHASDFKNLQTFTTVAHEGMPGHMYQFNYAREHLSEPMRWSILGSIAYQEGYATYAEFYSVRYLKGLNVNDLKAYTEYMQYVNTLVILLDIGIHYEGWDIQTSQEKMEEYGLPIDQALYDQLLYSPCAFEPYYVGFEEIMSMKDTVKKKLGKRYDEKEFHTALLEAGAAPFDIVWEHINAYIETKS